MSTLGPDAGEAAPGFTESIQRMEPRQVTDAARKYVDQRDFGEAKRILDAKITNETTDPDLIMMHSDVLNALHEDPESQDTFNDVMHGLNELIRAHEAADDPMVQSRLSFAMAEAYGRVGEYAFAQSAYLGAIDIARAAGQENKDAAFMEDGDTDNVLRGFHTKAMKEEKAGRIHEARLLRERAVVYALPIPDELQQPAEEAGPAGPFPEPQQS